MPGWNGSGVFNRVYSWVSDAAAGIDISASRMDTDTDEITSNGFGNCLTRDGQGSATANLPMNTFKFTGMGAGSANTDSITLGQAQAATANWIVFGGSADAITATYAPVVASLVDGQLFFGRATAANATTTPTFSPNGIGPYTITKNGGAALAANDIDAQYAEVILRYNLANTRFELMNPSTASLQAQLTAGLPSTGDVKPTYKQVADTGWVLMNDSTIGDASSGASFASSTAQALFTLFYASPFTDSSCPLLTSTGVGTTRAAQGTAAAAWAAHCRITLPLALGRALAFAGAGSGLTSRVLGTAIGAETVTIAQSGLPNIAPTFTGTPGTATSTNTNIPINATSPAGFTGGGATVPIVAGIITNLTSSFTPAGTISSINGNTTQTATSIMQPTTFLNVMCKL